MPETISRSREIRRDPLALLSASARGEFCCRLRFQDAHGITFRLPKTSNGETANLGYTVEVCIYMHDAEPVVEGGLGYEEIGNRDSMPHAVMVGQVPLEPKGSIEHVRWGRYDFEIGT